MSKSIYNNSEFLSVFNKYNSMIEIDNLMFVKDRNNISMPMMVQKYEVNDPISLIDKLEKFKSWELKLKLNDYHYRLIAKLNFSVKLKINYKIVISDWDLNRINSRNSRSKFRRSLKKNQIFLKSELNNEIKDIILESAKKFNVQNLINSNNFVRLYNKFDCLIYVSKNIENQTMNGFGFFINYRNTMYYLWGSGDVTAIILNAINYCKENKVEFLDFEGSTIPGVENFYSKFEPMLDPYLLIKKNNSKIFNILRRISSLFFKNTLL